MTADPVAYALKYHVQNAREPQWCDWCEEAWPCVTKMLADRVSLYEWFMRFVERDIDSMNKSFAKLSVMEKIARKKHSPKRSRKK